MAVYNLPNYVNEQGFGLPLNIRRGNPNPLDNSSVWKSLAEAQNYAQNDPTAYVGQIISVVNYTPAVLDDEGAVATASQSTVEVYYIKDEAGVLEPVGTSPVGDEGTITVAEDGTVSLYGIAGLALTREDEDGETVNITYQPLYVNGKLTWVEPSATTVEGLATEIEGLKTRISALETAVGDAEGGLVKDVADNAAAIEELNGKAHEHSNADVIDAITAEKVAAWDKAEENAKAHTDELAEGAVKDNTDAIAAIKDGEELDSFADVEAAIGNINTKIGEVVEGKTVVEMISDAQAAATYDDTDVKADIAALGLLVGDESVAIQIGKETTRAQGVESGLETRLKKVEDDYLKASDRTDLEDAIDAAEESAVNRVLGYLAEEEINTSYDTLKEVAAWIESDTTNSAELIGRVTAIEEDYLKGADKTELQDAIGELEAFVGALPEGATSETVVAYIQEAIDGLKIGDYAKAADLTELAGRVTTAEGKISALELKVGDESVSKQISDAIVGKVDKAEGYRLMAETEGTKLAGIAEGANVNVIDTVDTAQFGLENKHLTLLDIAMGKVTGLSDALANKVEKVEGSRLLTEDEATKLEKLVIGDNGEVTVSGKVAAGNVEGLDAWITARAGTLEGLSENNLSDTLLAKLEGIAEGAQVNVIDSVSDEFIITGKNLAIKEVAQDKIIGLSDALAGKVDVVEGYSLISDTELDRISKIESGAQVNKIENIKVGETLLEIVDKTVVIPVGAGLKASDEVAIAEDGTLGIGEVNVNKLVQSEGDYLVLNGGAAAL